MEKMYNKRWSILLIKYFINFPNLTYFFRKKNPHFIPVHMIILHNFVLIGTVCSKYHLSHLTCVGQGLHVAVIFLRYRLLAFTPYVNNTTLCDPHHSNDIYFVVVFSIRFSFVVFILRIIFWVINALIWKENCHKFLRNHSRK